MSSYLIVGFPNTAGDYSIITSPDLSGWATPTLSYTPTIENVFYQGPWIAPDGSLWLCAGNGMQASTDGGLTWTEVIAGTNGGAGEAFILLTQGYGTNVALDPVTKRCIVVGEYDPATGPDYIGAIYYADPPYTSWTLVQIDQVALGGYSNDIIWAAGNVPGVAFTISGAGIILTSTDGGATWTKTHDDGAGTQVWWEYEWNGSYLVAYADGSTDQILTSTNGSTWTAVTTPFYRITLNIVRRHLIWDTTRSEWVALGQLVSGHGMSVYTSPDANTWTSVYGVTFTTDGSGNVTGKQIYDIEPLDTGYYLFGGNFNGTTGANALGVSVWSTTDLATFVEIDTTAMPGFDEPGAGMLINTGGILEGINGDTAMSGQAYRSIGGSVWTLDAAYPLGVVNEQCSYQLPVLVVPPTPPTPGFLDAAVPMLAVVYDLNAQVFWPIMQFVWDNITCCCTAVETVSLDWSDWVPVTSWWSQVPYPSWSAIPSLADVTTYIGTEGGYAMRLFGAATDNGRPIAYNATWGLRAAPQLTQNMKVSWLECYLRQIPNALGSPLPALNEAIEADVVSYIQPLDANPTQIMSLAIALSDQSTFYSMVEPGPTNPANLPINWLQFSIQGAGNPSSNNFFFSGATLYMNMDDKPDYQSVGGVPTR